MGGTRVDTEHKCLIIFLCSKSSIALCWGFIGSLLGHNIRVGEKFLDAPQHVDPLHAKILHHVNDLWFIILLLPSTVLWIMMIMLEVTMMMKQMENMQSHRLPHRVVWSIDDVRKPVRLFYPILIISNSNNIATLPTNINIVVKILSLIKNLEGFANKWQLVWSHCVSQCVMWHMFKRISPHGYQMGLDKITCTPVSFLLL